MKLIYTTILLLLITGCTCTTTIGQNNYTINKENSTTCGQDCTQLSKELYCDNYNYTWYENNTYEECNCNLNNCIINDIDIPNGLFIHNNLLYS